MNDQLSTRTINISGTASAKGLREWLVAEAASRGMKVPTLVSAVYTYAVKHQDAFTTPLQNPKPKGGEHIGAKVPENVAITLQKWATATNRSRGYLCCYVLEKVQELGILEEIISQYTFPIDL